MPNLPYYFRPALLQRVALGLFIFAFLFVFLLEPFTINRAEHRIDYLSMSLLKGALVGVTFYVYFSILNRFRPHPEQWPLTMHLLHTTIASLIVGIWMFLIRDLIYDNPKNWSWHYFWEELRNLFVVNIFFNGIWLPIELFGRKPTAPAAVPIANNGSTLPKLPHVFIETEVQADAFDLSLADFLFAEAEGNYTIFYLKAPDGYRKEMKRISLKELESQLAPYPTVVRTHRSFLVHTVHIIERNGNAQGYRLKLADYPGEVPVSRSRIRTVVP